MSLQARSTILLIALVAFAILPSAVAATTYLTFSPLQLEPEDLMIYNASGALMGRYNTSSAAIALADNGSYTILVVPSNTNLLANHPDTWFAGFVDYLQEHAVSLMIAIFLLGILIAAIRRR